MAALEFKSANLLGTRARYAYAVKAGPWIFLTGHEAFDLETGVPEAVARAALDLGFFTIDIASSTLTFYYFVGGWNSPDIVVGPGQGHFLFILGLVIVAAVPWISIGFL